MKRFLRCLKGAFKIQPAILPLILLKNIALASLPFISLYFAGNIVTILTSGGSFEDCLFSILMLAFLTLACALVTLICNKLLIDQNEFLIFKLTAMLVEKSFALPYDVFEKEETRNIILKAERGSNGSGGFEYFFDACFGKMIYNLISIVYSLILLSDCLTSIVSENDEPLFLFLNNPSSICVVFGSIFITMAITLASGYFHSKNMMKFFENNVEFNRRGGYLSDLTSSSTLAKDIRVYQMDRMLLKILSNDTKEMTKVDGSMGDKLIVYSIINFLATSLTLGVAYLYVAGKAYYGIIGVGSIITVVGAISALASSLNSGINCITQAHLMTSYLTCFFDYLDLPDDNEEGDPVPKGEDVIAFEHVTFRYPNTEVDALSDVSFEITPNKKTAIVGPNGAGKSTIIKLISRLYSPSSGRITFNGVDISTLSKKEYGRLMAILFQDFSLFPFTLGENVSSSLEYDEEKVRRCLELSGFDMSSAPEGLDTKILSSSAEGKDFSGGEKQKIAIARALYKESKFVLLDEPTSALDPKSEQEVYASIAKLINDKTSLFISHRMSSTKFCDEIFVLDEGRLVEHGTHQSLMKDEGLYSKLFNEQAKYYK